MSRYIDAEVLRHRVLYWADSKNLQGNHEQTKAFNYCLCMIDDAPTADVVEVKHGRWTDTGSGQECSLCTEIQYGYDSARNYCPNCGADMRGKEE